MAFVMGIRLASYAVAGAALIITHETTKGAKEKLRQWVVDKFNSWSSDPAPQPPKPCDAGRKVVSEGGDLVDAGTPADIQEPTLSPVKVTENAIKADPMAEGDDAVNGVRPAHLEEATLTAFDVTENAVEGDPTVEQSQSDQENAINVPVSGEFLAHGDAESDNAANGDLTAEPLQRHGVNPTSEAPALVVVDAVRVGETRAMDESCQTDSDDLAQDAPYPAPPPGPGIRRSFVAAAVNAMKDWAKSLFNSLAAISGNVLDPKVRDKVRRVLMRVGLPVIECVILEPLLFRHHKVWRKIYNAWKNDIWTAWCG